MKKHYSEPKILKHEDIAFETLLSCRPPNEPGQIYNGSIEICVRPDGTFFPR